MVLRIVAALLAASITPAVFGISARLAAPGTQGRALGIVAAGLTVSLVVGVPLGSLLADSLGWRSTFLAVAVFSAIVAASNARFLPRLPGAPEIGVREQLRILSRPAILTCVLGTVIGASSGMLIYTYIGPVTRTLTGHGGAVLAVFIATVGVAGAIGTVLGGRLTDRWGADRTLVRAFVLVVLAVIGLAASGIPGGQSVPVWLVAGILAIYGFGAWGFNPPMNARVLNLAGEAGTEAVALNTSALYVGISLAGAIGGWSIAAYGGRGATVAAALISVATLVTMIGTVRRFPSG